MRFKLHFDDQKQTIEINCLNDSNADIIIPEDTSQPVYFPIPNEMNAEIKKYLMKLVDDEMANEFKELSREIKNLTDKRRQMVNDLRAKINPLIVEECRKFRDDYAEHFI